MKVVISFDINDTYQYFIPIATWSWNRIGVGVEIFYPRVTSREEDVKIQLVNDTMNQNKADFILRGFLSPKHKEATYAQCLRLYAAAMDLPEDEILILSDSDMLVFGDYLKQKNADFDIFGYDLTPPNQYPICYISASVKNWRNVMGINGKTYQECIDSLLGEIECEHFRGNYFGKDQEEAFNKISQHPNIYLHGRAKPGTQFATRRVDRDNMFYEENINDQLIDAHLWRPGYTEENFPKILNLLQRMCPNDNFDWLISYTEKYRQLL